jgi:hypothetical protein
LDFKVWKMENHEKNQKSGRATARHLTPTLSVGHCPVFLAVHVCCCRSLILYAASRRRQSSICLAAPLHRHHPVLRASTQSSRAVVSLLPPPPSRAAHGAELERATARATFTPRHLAELHRATQCRPRHSAPLLRALAKTPTKVVVVSSCAIASSSSGTHPELSRPPLSANRKPPCVLPLPP